MIRTNALVLSVIGFLIAIGSPTLPVSAATPRHETWVLDQVIYPTPKDPSVIEEILKTHSIEALIAVLKSHRIQFQRQENRLDTALLPPDLYATISALPAGEPFISPKGDQSFASAVVGHESPPATPNNWMH